MKKYFYIDQNQTQQGPFSAEELRALGITPLTKIWYAGLAEWTEAGNLPELAPLFMQMPPYQGPTYAPGMPPASAPLMTKPDSGLAWAIIVTILCCWPFGIPAIIYATKVDTAWNQGRYEDAAQAARTAKKWTLVSVFSALAIWIIYVILIFALGMAPFWAAACMNC